MYTINKCWNREQKRKRNTKNDTAHFTWGAESRIYKEESSPSLQKLFSGVKAKYLVFFHGLFCNVRWELTGVHTGISEIFWGSLLFMGPFWTSYLT